MGFLYPDIIAPGVNLPIVTPQSPEGIERRKWDTPKSQGGYKNDGFQEYPKCLFKAGRPTKGNVMVDGSLTVHDRQQEAVALGQGWSLTQEAAIQRVHDEHNEMAKLAANRAFHDRRMSDVAQREAEQREASLETIQHVPELPAEPVKRRPGRPKKAVSA